MKIKLFTGMLIFTLFLSNFGIISYSDSYTATKIFYQPKMHNQNHNKFLNQHKKTQVEKLIHSYQNNFVSAINSGDFSLVSSDILPGSKKDMFSSEINCKVILRKRNKGTSYII